jgi:hypothetical protein
MRFKLLILLFVPLLSFGQGGQPVASRLDVTDSITATLARDVTIGGDLAYEMVHFFAHKEDTTVTPNCAGASVYVKILPNWRTGWGLDENDGFTFAGDTITIITPGDYFMIYSFTVQGSVGDDFKVAVFKNAVKIYGVKRTTTGSTNFGGGTLPFYFINLIAGDDLSIKVANLTGAGTNDPTFTNLNWFIYKIPE